MSEKNTVIKEVEAMSKAFRELDLAGVLSFYEENSTLVLEPGLSVSGIASLSEAFKGFFAIKPEFKFEWHDVTISGDIAVHTGPWKMIGADPSTNDTIEDRGLSVSVWRKQPSGKWKMIVDNPKGEAKGK